MKCPLREKSPNEMAECVGEECGFWYGICGKNADAYRDKLERLLEALDALKGNASVVDWEGNVIG